MDKQMDLDVNEVMELGRQGRGKEPMVFDWDEAARRIKASGATNAVAGLQRDMGCTSGSILLHGKPLTERDSTYTYLASTWATPVLVLDGTVERACYRMKSETPGWDADTLWPESALAILSAP